MSFSFKLKTVYQRFERQVKDLKKLMNDQKGLSLMEILISLGILALAGTFVGNKVFESMQEGYRQSAVIQMQHFASSLKDFRRHCGFYPDTSQGLDALISKPEGRECKKYRPSGYFAKEAVPEDPWGNLYEYVSDGKTFNIVSYGNDGVEGGDGFDKDEYLYPKKESDQE